MDLPRIIRSSVSQSRGAVSDNTGNAAARSYASLAHGARNVGLKVIERRQIAGTRAGQEAFFQASAQAGQGGFVNVEKPRKGFLGRIGVFGDAYNQAVQALQLSRAEIDIKRQIASIRAETTGNPKGFQDRMDAWRAEYLQGTDGSVAGAVVSRIDQLTEKAFLDRIDERQSADIKEARTAITSNVANLESELLALIAEDGPDAVTSEQFARLNDQLEFWQHQRINNPLYEYSSEEAALDDRNLQRRLENAALLPQIRQIFDREGRAGALEAVDQVIDDLDLTPAEAVTMRSSLRNEINQLQEIDAAREAEFEQAEVRRKKQIDKTADDIERDLIETLANDQLRADQKYEAIRKARDYLTPGAYDKFVSRVTGGNANNGVSPQTFAEDIVAVRKGILSEEEIFDGGYTQTQITKLLSEKEKYQNAVGRAGVEIIDGWFPRSALTDLSPEYSAQITRSEEEFDQWLSENREATPEMARQAAKEIAINNGSNINLKNYSRFYLGDKPEDFKQAIINISKSGLGDLEIDIELEKIDDIRELKGRLNNGN